MGHDSYGTWLIWDMTHMGHDSTCVICLIEWRHDSCVVTLLIWDITHMGHDSYGTWLIEWRTSGVQRPRSWLNPTNIIWFIRVPHMKHDSFMCYICDMTHKWQQMWHIWLIEWRTLGVQRPRPSSSFVCHMWDTTHSCAPYATWYIKWQHVW